MKKFLIFSILTIVAACAPVTTTPAVPAVGSAIRMAGDSNTVGHGFTPYSTLVSSDTGQLIDNIAISGMSMTRESNYGLTYYTDIPEIIESNIVNHGVPSVLSVMGGTNDFRDWGIYPSTNLATLELVVTQLNTELTAEGIAVVWITPPPFGTEADFPATAFADRVTYNQWLKDTFPLVADCGTQLQDSTGWMNPVYDSGDGVHVNEAGQQVIAQCLEAAL